MSVLFSSASVEWATPVDLYDRLNAEFNFDLDAAAAPHNAKHTNYLTNCLEGDWDAKTAFMNPPWGRSIGHFIKKAYEQSRRGITVVCLLPSCTDTKWWRDYVWKAAEIRLITGRLRFIRDDGHTGPSTKGACLAIFASWSEGPPAVKMGVR